MSTIKNQLKQCFELLAKIREGYPEGEFDREMLHGDMDFRYRQIKEDREKLEAFPSLVREFARFKHSLTVPDEAVKTFFRSLIKEPKRFIPLSSIQFQQRQKRLEEWAAESETAVSYLNELLTRTRLSGILDVGYRLDESYLEVISAYLDL
jgi:hypothetical protein